MSSVLLAIMAPNPDNPEALQEYGEKTPVILQKFGGKPVNKKVVKEVICGAISPKAITTIEFPSEEKIYEFLNSAEYQAMIPVRDKAFSEATLIVAE